MITTRSTTTDPTRTAQSSVWQLRRSKRQRSALIALSSTLQSASQTLSPSIRNAKKEMEISCVWLTRRSIGTRPSTIRPTTNSPESLTRLSSTAETTSPSLSTWTCAGTWSGKTTRKTNGCRLKALTTTPEFLHRTWSRSSTLATAKLKCTHTPWTTNRPGKSARMRTRQAATRTP